MHGEDTVRLGRVGIWITGLLAVCLLIGLAAPARAELRVLDYTGSLSIGFGVPADVIHPVSGSILAGTEGGHLSALFPSWGAFGPITTSVPVTTDSTINSVLFTGVGNLSAAITGISGGSPLGSGAMGMSGLAKICLVFAPCVYANVSVPLTPTTGGAGFGVGGTQTFPGFVALTMQHTGWTIGQPTMTFHTATSFTYTTPLPGGFVHGPASLTSSTARPSGEIQLVSVSKVITSLTGAFPELPVIATLNLHFVPEPGTLLLLGSGVAALAVVGRRRTSR